MNFIKLTPFFLGVALSSRAMAIENEPGRKILSDQTIAVRVDLNPSTVLCSSADYCNQNHLQSIEVKKKSFVV